MKTVLILWWLAVLLPLPAFSQPATPTTTASAKKKKVRRRAPKKVMVSFDEDLVEGSMTGTDLFMIMQKKQTRFGHLFELRENFIPEMYENAEEITPK